tara:strand:- start:39 stop:551 length:513 start_codon:yes stop_codon:yes gene_type:complete
MAEIIAIGGVPASGKSTLMKKVIKEYKLLKTFKYGLIRGLYDKEKNLYFIGIYDDSVFCGTDKLSMAVQPHFFKLIDKLPDARFVFEGDRLFNQSLFDKYDCEIVVLNANEETIEQRHKQRSDNQTDRFKRAKQTKINNILNKNEVTVLDNNTEQDAENLFNHIIKLINK